VFAEINFDAVNDVFTIATADNTFILTTDADVMFTPESVEALLDVLVSNRRVGAVCSRTFPLGSGPVYWYQIFDYAIGHWLIKVSLTNDGVSRNC
jgi:GT2 family glycosyltransferase